MPLKENNPRLQNDTYKMIDKNDTFPTRKKTTFKNDTQFEPAK